jgi:hypothetical protein
MFSFPHNRVITAWHGSESATSTQRSRTEILAINRVTSKLINGDARRAAGIDLSVND